MAEHLVLDRVVKTYPGGHAALAEVSLEVEPGTFLVLLGPSGSGKTTLLRCLAGIERLSGGRVVIGGATVADGRLHLPPERRNLSMVFQDYALWPHLAARDNVAFATRRLGLGKEQGRALAEQMLARVGLGHLAGRFPSQLSGGEQQRVALARALVADTGLLLCDEPLSNLDADLRERMRIQISELVRQAGATTIYITHDQSEAFALADRVGVLQSGRIVQLGVPEEIYLRPASPFVARFTGLAGELAVRITGLLSEDRVEVRPLAPCASPIVASVDLGAAPTGPALLTIRPAAVRICPPGNGDYHLRALVKDVAFRGRGYEHAVVLEDGSQLNGVFSEIRAARGEPVGLHLDPAGCLVFPGEQPVATPGVPGGPGVEVGAGAGSRGLQLTGAAHRGRRGGPTRRKGTMEELAP